MRLSALLFSIIAIIIPGITINAADTDDIYRKEADTFLTGMPRNLQQQQMAAIRQAIEGDSQALRNVRNARNIPPELPPQVSRTDINDRLSLFRCQRYANDTIPLLIYLHGGGWTIGSINSCTRFCTAIATKGIAVLAVDYRLAPEHPFPAGLNDCIEAVKTAADSLTVWKCSDISLGGDSSGGNLAITTALSFPERTFRSLVTFYPVTRAYPDDSASWAEFGQGFGLDSDLMERFNNAYTDDIHNPLVSPAEASDNELRKLPPTLIIGAERDILRDQATEFAGRLRHIGKDVRHHIIPGTVHLFITVPGQSAAFDYAVDETSAFIRNITGYPR